MAVLFESNSKRLFIECKECPITKKSSLWFGDRERYFELPVFIARTVKHLEITDAVFKEVVFHLFSFYETLAQKESNVSLMNDSGIKHWSEYNSVNYVFELLSKIVRFFFKEA